MTGLRYVDIDGRFIMMHGELESPRIAYETWGARCAEGANAVMIFTGLSPSSHVASSADDPSTGWWEDMVGPAKPIDTNVHYVICINSLGSCFGSTGPASINPGTDEPYRLAFPVLTIEDIASAGALVLDHLGIERLEAVVGASMGGMTALAFSLMYPERVSSLICISAAARSQPFAIALRSLQREMIRCDPAWQNGNYSHAGNGPVNGMRLARKLGMVSYRSAEEWLHRFGRERAVSDPKDEQRFGIDFEIEAYLEAHAKRFIGNFDANCYLYLSRAMDLFDVSDHGGSLEHAFRRVRLNRAMVVGARSDFLFPIHQQEELARGLSTIVDDVVFHRLESIHGHDSFLVDMDRFRPVIADFFE